MNTYIFNNARNAFVATVFIFALGILSFFAFEPTLGQAITDEFVVSQQITNEISWNATSTDVTMTGTIAGLTGGYATGTATQSINTNNATGYNMTLSFADDGDGNVMGDGNGNRINNYTPATPGTPDFAWVDNASGGTAEFGYTVNTATAAEVAAAFKDNASTCGSGTASTDSCWMSPSTTPKIIVNSTAANGNSSSTIKFKVAVPNAPSPALPSGFYTATATLTAIVNS